jgi:hypothetical protein
MKQFMSELAALVMALLRKLVSVKVCAFAVGTALGAVMAKPLGATFVQWAGFQLILLVIFFTANQYQKWLFGMILSRGGNDATELS